jgi:hypothetical protein
MISYLSSLRSVPYKYLSGHQQHNIDSLTSVAEECNDKEVVQSASHGPLGVVFHLRCDSSIGRPLDIA